CLSTQKIVKAWIKYKQHEKEPIKLQPTLYNFFLHYKYFKAKKRKRVANNAEQREKINKKAVKIYHVLAKTL
ncbi:MAG: hypothetical protein AAGG80_06760, partial [Pseudomonadota bacterium]